MKPAWNIPAGIFALRGEAEKGVGQRFESDDGSRPVHLRTRERGGRYTFQLSQEESTAGCSTALTRRQSSELWHKLPCQLGVAAGRKKAEHLPPPKCFESLRGILWRPVPLASQKHNPRPYAEVDGKSYPGQDNDERVKPHFFPSEATAALRILSSESTVNSKI